MLSGVMEKMAFLWKSGRKNYFKRDFGTGKEGNYRKYSMKEKFSFHLPNLKRDCKGPASHL